MREQENYEKSIQYSIDRLNASVEEWSNNLVSSDVIKFFVDLLNVIVEISNALTPLGTLAVGGGIFAGVKNFDNIKKEIESILNATDIGKTINANAYVGSDGLFDTDTLRSYREQLNGLTLAQQKAALSSVGLTKEQKNQVLSYMASANAVKSLTGEQILERLSTEMSSKADAKRVLTKAGLIGATESDMGATIVLTEAKKKEILASELLNAEEKRLILSLFGESTAKTGVIAATWELVKANMALIASNPFTWIAGGIAIALGLAAAYEAVHISIDEAKEKLDETESELSEVNSQIEENVNKIKEIQSLDTLSITDKEDLERLKAENRELAIRQKYLEKQEQKDKAQLAESTKEEYSNRFGENANNKRKAQAVKTWGAGHENTNTTGDYIQDAINNVEEYRQLKSVAIENEDVESLDKWSKKLEESESNLYNLREELQGYSDNLRDAGDTGSKEFQKIQSSIQAIDQMLLSPGENLVNFINSEELEDDKQKIIELASNGELTSKVLESSFSEVNDYLKENGLSLQDLISILDLYKEELGEVPSVVDNTALTENLNTAYDSIQKSYDAVEEFKKAMSSGMTESALDGVAALSSELKAMVAGYHAGLVSADELYSALQEHYDNDLKNYGKALIAKNEYSEDFYNAIGLADSEFINSMYNGYEVDLSNCKNYNEAKLAIEAQAINKLGDMWSKYYNAQIGSYTAEFQSLARSIEILERTGQSDKAAPLKEIAQKVGQQVRNYQAAINKLDDAVYSGITSNFKGISSGLDNNSDKGSGGGSSGSETEEVIDHIATKIERLERQIESLGKTAGATYKDWQERNEALSDQITLTTEEIALQEEALAYYQKKANSVGLSKEYQDLVKYGGIRIDTIKDENLSKKISEYQEWYEKILACEDAIEDLNAELANLAKQKFDNISSEFDNKFSSIEHEMNVLEALIDKTETRGHVVSTKYYESLIEAEKKNIELLEKEYEQLIDEFSNAMETGDIEEGSEDFYAMKETINEVKLEIIEANTELIEFENSIRDLEWENFDRLQEKISAITDEAEFLISLMEDSDLYDDNGQLTDTGMGTLGLRVQNYNVLMNQADQYANEIEKINAELANDPNNQELLERKQELIELQRESILAANDEKNAIRDMVQEGIDLELEALQERIDKIKETQEEMQALYEYQKKVSEQTKNIANLEKQLSAYEGDDSEENQARIQQIKLDLEEARKTLEETETEYALSETQKMLDELYSEYELILSERMDNIDALLGDMIESTNANASTINDTLIAESEKVGYTISDSIQDIWSNEGAATAIVTKYGDEFNSQLTSVNNVLNAIATEMGAIVEESDKEAESNIQDAVKQPEVSKPTESKPSAPTTPPPSDTKKEESKAIKVGSMIDATGAKIYDYAGDKSGENQYFKDSKYVVLKEKDGYLQVRHHSLKSGITGWFKKSDVKAYKTGGLADETGLAWLDGTKSKPEMVLNAKDTKNYMELTDILRKATRDDSILFDNDKFMKNIEELSSNLKPEFNSFIAKLPHMNTDGFMGNMNNVFNMNFELHEVQSGRDVVNFLIKDKTFENAIQAMTVDRLAGGSKFAKSKYYKG